MMQKKRKLKKKETQKKGNSKKNPPQDRPNSLTGPLSYYFIIKDNFYNKKFFSFQFHFNASANLLTYFN
jgi:hypothetical protein